MATNRSETLSSTSLARFGCYGGLLAAVALVGVALVLLFQGTNDPMPLKLAFLSAGLLQGLVSVLALRRNRAAWAFALSINGTLSLAFLFGAPKVRDGLDVSLPLGLAPALAFATVAILLALGSDDY